MIIVFSATKKSKNKVFIKNGTDKTVSSESTGLDTTQLASEQCGGNEVIISKMDYELGCEVD